MSDFGYNLWGVIAGALGTLGLIPALAFYFLGRFPTGKLATSEDLLKETEKMFQEAVRDGLIYREDDLQRFHASFWSIKVHLDDVRLEVYAIRTWRDEIASWLGGLSGRIHIVYKDTYILRTKLARTSSRQRRALAAAGHTSKLALLSSMRGRASHNTPYLMSHVLPSRTPSMTRLHDANLQASTPASSSGGPLSASAPRYATREDLHASSDEAPVADKDGNSLPCDDTVPSADPPPHLISDETLKQLLSLALANSTACRHEDYRQRRPYATARRQLLLRFGTQLFGPETAPMHIEVLLPTRSPKRSRLKALGRLFRRERSERPQDIYNTAQGAAHSDVSPQLVGDEGDEWHDV
ncbi:hypothetical protein BV20DRAFT_982800 [Pilatotrama ljubarskyi]|nr:hypothetical protein BV20DRAFT_982800 [Pilatotrama ljubarskyi]